MNGGRVLKIRKNIGSLILLLATVVISGSASMFGIGVEDMPDSMKNKR